MATGFHYGVGLALMVATTWAVALGSEDLSQLLPPGGGGVALPAGGIFVVSRPPLFVSGKTSMSGPLGAVRPPELDVIGGASLFSLSNTTTLTIEAMQLRVAMDVSDAKDWDPFKVRKDIGQNAGSPAGQPRAAP